MGIAGAGLSTALSQVVSFGILLSTFLTGKTQSKIHIKNVSLQFNLLSDIVGTGAPSLLRQGLNSITTILLNSEAAIYGDAAIAAMSIVSRIFFFVFSVAIGIGQGFQPVSGFNYGAKKFKRYRKAFRFTFILSEILMFVIGSFVFINAATLVGMLRDDIEVIHIGTRALQLQCVAALFLPLCMVCEMALQSTGQKLYAIIISSLRSGAIFIPCLLILANIRGIAGIQEAQPLSYVISSFITFWFVKKFFETMPKEDR